MKRKSGSEVMESFRKAPYGTNRLARKMVSVKRNGAPNTPGATRGFGANYGAAGEKKVSDKPSDPVLPDLLGLQADTTVPAGSIVLLHAPKVGSEFTSRVGRKTCAKSIYIRGICGLNGPNTGGGPTAGFSPSQQLRMILFVDWQPNGAAPVATDILKFANSASQLNLNNRDRFHIIKDKVWFFDTSTSNQAAINRTGASVKVYKKINIETTFNGTVSQGNSATDTQGAIADISTGAIYMMWVGSATASATTAGRFSGTTRIRYVDT